MSDAIPTLLPSGFFDLLPPEAGRQRRLYQQVVTTLESFGYAEVCPPLMEFETSLLAGKAASLSAQTFRLMDPLSREMMGIRADITLQVSRIAGTRLADEPKPLRLCYAGTCLRVIGEGLHKRRQFQQAGAELIGSDCAQADSEILRVAVACLASLELGAITIDINLPELTEALVSQAPESQQNAFRNAILCKDRSLIGTLDIPFREAVITLLDNAPSPEESGQWNSIIQQLPGDTGPLLENWLERARSLQQAAIPARLTFDPLEHQGFEYHSGMAFSIFAEKIDSEIGRGGRYFLNDGTPAVGFSIYLSPLRAAMPAETNIRKCYVLSGNNEADCQRLRDEGWTTLYALDEKEAIEPVARRNRCSHLLKQGKLIPLENGDTQS